MEIPDVIAVNKCDHPLARTTANDVRQVLSLGTARRREAAGHPHRRPHRRRPGGAVGGDHGARRVAGARGAEAAQPRGRGLRRRVRARASSARVRGRRGSRARPPARTGAAPRARPPERGACDS
jgi:hypothetical protein